MIKAQDSSLFDCISNLDSSSTSESEDGVSLSFEVQDKGTEEQASYYVSIQITTLSDEIIKTTFWANLSTVSEDNEDGSEDSTSSSKSNRNKRNNNKSTFMGVSISDVDAYLNNGINGAHLSN